MSQNLPFRSIKITLSEEALNRLDAIQKQASFRSYSSSIEECIRVVYDMMNDVFNYLGTEDKAVQLSAQEQVNGYRRDNADRNDYNDGGYPR